MAVVVWFIFFCNETQTNCGFNVTVQASTSAFAAPGLVYLLKIKGAV